MLIIKFLILVQIKGDLLNQYAYRFLVICRGMGPRKMAHKSKNNMHTTPTNQPKNFWIYMPSFFFQLIFILLIKAEILKKV